MCVLLVRAVRKEKSQLDILYPMISNLFVVVSFEVAREDLEISHAFSLSWGNIPVTASITPGNQKSPSLYHNLAR